MRRRPKAKIDCAICNFVAFILQKGDFEMDPWEEYRIDLSLSLKLLPIFNANKKFQKKKKKKMLNNFVKKLKFKNEILSIFKTNLEFSFKLKKIYW